MDPLTVFTLRRRVRRLAIRLEVDALANDIIARDPDRAAARDFYHAKAVVYHDAAARIREVLDDAEQ